jgi:hypothetical protein
MQAKLFSAAIPGQGGDHHVNEQWPSYWQSKFKKYGYCFHDILRWKIWNHPDVDLWYKQNMFIVAHESIEIKDNDHCKQNIVDIVHPEYFRYKTTCYVSVSQSFTSIIFAFKIFVKNLLRKIRLIS